MKHNRTIAILLALAIPIVCVFDFRANSTYPIENRRLALSRSLCPAGTEALLAVAPIIYSHPTSMDLKNEYEARLYNLDDETLQFYLWSSVQALQIAAIIAYNHNTRATYLGDASFDAELRTKTQVLTDLSSCLFPIDPRFDEIDPEHSKEMEELIERLECPQWQLQSEQILALDFETLTFDEYYSAWEQIRDETLRACPTFG